MTSTFLSQSLGPPWCFLNQLVETKAKLKAELHAALTASTGAKA